MVIVMSMYIPHCMHCKGFSQASTLYNNRNYVHVKYVTA